MCSFWAHLVTADRNPTVGEAFVGFERTLVLTDDDDRLGAVFSAHSVCLYFSDYYFHHLSDLLGGLSWEKF